MLVQEIQVPDVPSCEGVAAHVVPSLGRDTIDMRNWWDVQMPDFPTLRLGGLRVHFEVKKGSLLTYSWNRKQARQATRPKPQGQRATVSPCRQPIWLGRPRCRGKLGHANSNGSTSGRLPFLGKRLHAVCPWKSQTTRRHDPPATPRREQSAPVL